jgi:hypothetical protein
MRFTPTTNVFFQTPIFFVSCQCVSSGLISLLIFSLPVPCSLLTSQETERIKPILEAFCP